MATSSARTGMQVQTMRCRRAWFLLDCGLQLRGRRLCFQRDKGNGHLLWNGEKRAKIALA
eukprot:5410966-Lingulodinium_polyedra.AAC.1